MMPFYTKRIRIATSLLAVWFINLLTPAVSLALTSGPSQPEAKAFQAAGVSDMVDLSTGDMKYNIPLMDVGGYPINLNYKSGVGMDDEASWVGLGWNINVGAINRQLRGLPDDFAGDEIETEHYTKPKITIGGRGNAKIELAGSSKVTPSLSFTLGVFSDNYTGIGAEVGANAGISYSFANSGFLTAGLGVGVLSSTASGVDVTPNFSLSLQSAKTAGMTTSATASLSQGYNTRSGLKTLSLGSSFSVTGRETLTKEVKDANGNPVKDSEGNPVTEDIEKVGSTAMSLTGSTISYNTEPISPKIAIPYHTTYESYSIDAGGAAWFIFGGGGLTGYKSVRKVLNNAPFKTRAYGFLYADLAKHNLNGLMDFVREKDNPIVEGIPNLAVPVHTPDLFSYTSQAGGGQFRLYRDGTGVFADNEVNDVSEMHSDGADYGGGAYFHGGITVFDQHTSNKSGKWNLENEYINKADFQSESASNPETEKSYFKLVGEHSLSNTDWKKQGYFNGEKPVAISVNGTVAENKFQGQEAITSSIASNKKQARRTSISYLTAKEASNGGVYKHLEYYPFSGRSYVPDPGFVPTPVSRTAGRNADHISEITVTDEGGKRMVYGMPVYNKTQEEYSFAVNSSNPANIHKNLIKFNAQDISRENKNGLDNYYHKEKQPAYASSYLLSGILSPDYVDKTGDGISDDDLGTAVEFHYSKIDNFNWRSPMWKGGGSYNWATFNKGLLADADDDKGSVVYGEKELCYLHSIETKTHIAYFITEDRLDALGVKSGTQGVMGALETGVKQKKLVEIRLYSKNDLSHAIKVVHLDHNYSLCTNSPNSEAPAGGKLTLTKVWFEYGQSSNGKDHPYEFSYHNLINGTVPEYGVSSTDRWGVYKTGTNPAGLANDEFPYTRQNDKPGADQAAALWQLKQIVLPSGGKINVDYESDDYAYVQDKRAMGMVQVNALVKEAGNTTILSDAKGIEVEVSAIPSTVSSAAADVRTAYFKQHYLNGSDYLYGRYEVEVTANRDVSSKMDNIPCYAKVVDVFYRTEGIKTFARIKFENLEEKGVSVNPVLMLAWQHIKNNYPKYAFPGYSDRAQDGDTKMSAKAAVNAIGAAFNNLDELKRNFYEKAWEENYASQIDPARCFVRLVKQDGIKTGGGSRVRTISIDDNWSAMSGNENRSYGQRYLYKTDSENGSISSGVAAYEPSVGGDENPLKQAIPYKHKIKGGLSNFLDLEEPFGESLFPAPEVVYSKVVVKDLDATSNPGEGYVPETGYVSHEFYTAKDFPVRVSYTAIKPYNYRPHAKFNFLSANSEHKMTLTQGYSLVLNDMHGKPRATRTFNKAKEEIASTVYHYNVRPHGDGSFDLKNEVDIVKHTGAVSKEIMAREIEFFTDMREQETINEGKSLNLGVDVTPTPIGIPFGLPHIPSSENRDHMLFRSACALKVVQYYGIIYKVVKTDNGSTVSTENVAYDSATGEPVVTRTQTENDDYVYSVNMPAYWAFKGMGGAYQNVGSVFSNLNTTGPGNMVNIGYYMLTAGDVILGVDNSGDSKLYWVTDYHTLIDASGYTFKGNLKTAKVIRSGYRNQVSNTTFSITCAKNPISNNTLIVCDPRFAKDLDVLNASAVKYSQQWANSSMEAVNNKSDRQLINNLNIYNSHGYNSNSYVWPKSPPYSSSSPTYYNTVQRPPYNYWCNPNLQPVDGLSNWWGVLVNGSNLGFMNANPSGLALRRATSSLWYNNPGNFVTADEVGITSSFTAPASGYYVIGYSGPPNLEIKIDNALTLDQDLFLFTSNDPNLIELKSFYLQAGQHTIQIKANKVSNDPTLSVEIFNHPSWYEVMEMSPSGQKPTIFSTSSDRSQWEDYIVVNGVKKYRYKYYVYKNPFLVGALGNWRPSESKVFLGNRKNSGAGPVKKTGYLKEFYPFWINTNQWESYQENQNTYWTTSNAITRYDDYGQELENRDALGRYSAASFIFKGELPAAVVSNAEAREFYSQSFEESGGDYTVAAGRFAHTGNYSLNIPLGGYSISAMINTRGRNDVFEYNDEYGYKFRDDVNMINKGFEPTSGKKYVISAWVRNKSVSSAGTIPTASVPVSAVVNSIAVSLKCLAVVEGWKLVSGEFTVSAPNWTRFSINFQEVSGDVIMDDLRIHPKDSHMKSFAHSSKKFKLMAEMDENNFATFYEYDDEGSLVRVKKETQRGIVTLKENHSSQFKH
ncbi:MAG: hypothetical protein H7Y13_16660 [Sphingobacteriaceae bacterium]|nr:hypothetical protein [Sphingobacteriaceae bacterium]